MFAVILYDINDKGIRFMRNIGEIASLYQEEVSEVSVGFCKTRIVDRTQSVKDSSRIIRHILRKDYKLLIVRFAGTPA